MITNIFHKLQFTLDLSKVDNLEKLILNSELIYQHQHYFNYSVKKKFIEGLLSRMNDIVLYINSHSYHEPVHAFNDYTLFNVIIHSKVLIDCIYLIAQNIYNNFSDEKTANFNFIENLKLDSSFFRTKVSDDKYFSYIRAMLAAHPHEIKKDIYREIMDQDEYCSHIIFDDNYQIRTVLLSENGDREIMINSKKVLDYIADRYSLLDEIVASCTTKLETEIKKLRNELKNKMIVQSYSEYSNYLKYLEKLKLEAKLRHKNSEYIEFNNPYKEYVPLSTIFRSKNTALEKHELIDRCINFFKQPISDEANLPKVELYLNALKLGINLLHSQLQEVKPIGNNFLLKFLLEFDVRPIVTDNDTLNNINLALSYKNDQQSALESLAALRKIENFTSKYVIIDDNLNNCEKYLLLMTSLYLYSLEHNTFLNKNIPLNNKYRVSSQN